MSRMHLRLYRMVGSRCFFFKQKTAYEMRIIDWSSDVCSSDLHRQRREIVLTLNDVDYEKFLRCKKAGTFLIVIVRPVSDSAATGKLFRNTNIMHTPVRRRVK